MIWKPIFENMAIEECYQREFYMKAQYFIEIIEFYLKGYMDSFTQGDMRILVELTDIYEPCPDALNPLKWLYCIIIIMVIIYKTDSHFSLRVISNFVDYPEFEADIIDIIFNTDVARRTYRCIL